MSKRLEEIKTSTINICSCESCYCDGFTLQWVGVEPEHFEWLVEEAELRQEQILKNNTALQYIDEIEKRYHELEEQNKRYREALERISEHEVYGIDIRCGEELSTDAGKIARTALEGDLE